MDEMASTAMSDRSWRPHDELNLAEYFELFPEALEEKYNNRFAAGFAAIEDRFKEVRSGRLLTAGDVMAIFDDSLPFVRDWTKPDRRQLDERMAKGASQLIGDLNGRHDLDLITRILRCFRELSLTSLVLQHVYPEKFSMCSHHIASLLYIVGHRSAGTVPEYYLEFCQELEKWGRRFGLTVVQTEYALWTWYRLANFGRKETRDEHNRRFDSDVWVRQQRAVRARESFAAEGKMGMARFCLDTDPALGAMIAWREFEIRVRGLPCFRGNGRDSRTRMACLIASFPAGQKEDYAALWEMRNGVMKRDLEISEGEARKVVETVQEFLDCHRSEFCLS